MNKLHFKSIWSAGKINNVSIKIHWSIIFIFPYFLYLYKNFLNGIIGTIASLFLLLMHELGHATMARRRKTRVHGIYIYPLHGLCVYDQPYYREDDILIAWGGVLAQLFILLIALIVQSLLYYILPNFYYSSQLFLYPIFNVFINVNIFIIIINLIPVQPLDGELAWQIMPMVKEWISTLRNKRLKPKNKK